MFPDNENSSRHAMYKIQRVRWSISFDAVGNVTSKGCWHHYLTYGSVFFDSWSFKSFIPLFSNLPISHIQSYDFCLTNEINLKLTLCPRQWDAASGTECSSDREFHPSVQGLHRRGRRGMYGLKLANDLVQRAGLRDLGAVVRTRSMLSHLRRRSGHQDQDLLWRFARISRMSREFHSGVWDFFPRLFQ